MMAPDRRAFLDECVRNLIRTALEGGAERSEIVFLLTRMLPELCDKNQSVGQLLAAYDLAAARRALGCDGKNHLICAECWDARNPDRPVPAEQRSEGFVVGECCCFCSGNLRTVGVIYVRSVEPTMCKKTRASA